MTHISSEPAKKFRQWSYEGVSIRRYHTNRVWYEYTIDMGFGQEVVMIYGKLIEARRSIDAQIEPRLGKLGLNMTKYEVHEGKIALKGLYK
jgi:hypothetical protein